MKQSEGSEPALSDAGSEKIKIELGGVAQTLLLPLWFRAKHNEKQNPLLLDPMASKIVRRVDYDYRRIDRSMQGLKSFWNPEWGDLYWVIRAKNFDDALKEFIARHPKAVVVNIGAGLDTTFYRVDNGSIRWYNLDLPDVIDLRRRLLPETDRCTCIAKSVFDFSWFDDISEPEDGLIILACGVFWYFGENDVKLIIRKLANRFHGAEIVFDAISRITAVFTTRFVRESANKEARPRSILTAKNVCKWDANVEVVEEYPNFAHIHRDPSWKSGTIRMMNMLDRGKAMRVIHLRFK